MNAEAAFESGVLNRDVHVRLVRDIEHVSSVAGIPKEFIWTEPTELSQKELNWINKFRMYQDSGKYGGMVLTGKPSEDKMMQMVGKLLRNFIDARLMMLHEVFDGIENKTMPKPTALFIPNFFITKDHGGNIPSWKVNDLLGLLMRRYSQNKLTILYVQDMKKLEVELGKPIADHLKEHYAII